MKLKTRLRRFWRNNKRISFMYGTLWFTILSVVPPYEISITLVDIAFVLANAALWGMEFRRAIEHRVNVCLLHKYRKCKRTCENYKWDALEWIIKETVFVQSRSYQTTDEFITAFAKQLDPVLVNFISCIREAVSESTDNQQL